MTNKTLELVMDMKYLIDEIEENLSNINFFKKPQEVETILTYYPSTSSVPSGHKQIQLHNYKNFKKQKNLSLAKELKQATDVYMLLLREAHGNALCQLRIDYESLSDETCDQLQEKYFPDESSK